jgi:hypothetical protein
MALRNLPGMLLSLAFATPGSALADDRSSAAGNCGLVVTAVEDARTEGCLVCHSGKGAPSASDHPVDFDYASVARGRTRGMSALRPVEEVVARGVFLPDGKLSCLTCHDARSPYRYFIALPPGARPAPAVNPRDPRTYASASAAHATVSAPGAKRAVTPKPLCLACHAFD